MKSLSYTGLYLDYENLDIRLKHQSPNLFLFAKKESEEFYEQIDKMHDWIIEFIETYNCMALSYLVYDEQDELQEFFNDEEIDEQTRKTICQEWRELTDGVTFLGIGQLVDYYASNQEGN